MNCRICEPRVPARQRGAALVIAMLVFAMCATLIVAMKGDFIRLYQRSANIFIAEQAYAYMRGAEELASIALLADYDQDRNQAAPRDDLKEIWAQPTAPYALDDGGWLLGSLQDLQGRFNLNALASSANAKARFTPPQMQFIRLLQALEGPAVSEQQARMITAAVVDWLDRDGRPGLDGAEDDYYLSRTPAHRAANRSMVSVSELRAVAHVTPEIYAALEPYVTVWPQAPATLNIHTAPALVLRSISSDKDFSPLPVQDIESLVSYREETGFTDLDDFLASPAFEGKRENMGGMRPLLGQQSSYFLLQAQVEVADRNMRLYSVLQRRESRVIAMVRATGSL